MGGVRWDHKGVRCAAVIAGLFVANLAFGQVGLQDIIDYLLGRREVPPTENADLNNDQIVDVADVVSKVNSIQATLKESRIIGRVYNIETRDPLLGYFVSVAGDEATKEEYSGGDFEYRVRVPADQFKSLVIVRIEAPDFTYCEKKLAIAPGETRHIGEVFLVPIDPAVAEVGPGGGEYQDSRDLVRVVIPAGAVDRDTTFRSASFPFDETLPSALPRPSRFTHCVELLPDGTQFNAPVTVRVRNTRGFDPGAQIPLGVYYRDAHEWRPEGMATVSADGAWMEFERTHFSPCDVNYTAPEPPEDIDPPDERRRRRRGGDDEEEGEDDEEDDEDCDDEQGGHSSVSTRSGFLKQEIPLFPYVSGPEERIFALEYCTRSAWPTAIAAINEHYEEKTDRKPANRMIEITVNNVRKRAVFDIQEEFSRYAYLFACRNQDGTWWNSGVYPGELALSYRYPVEFYTAAYFGGPPLEGTGVVAEETNLEPYPTFYPLNVGVQNLRESPFGNGWTVAGLQRIHWNGAGPLLLTEGTETKIFGSVGSIDTLAGTGEEIISSYYILPENGTPALAFPLSRVVAAVSNTEGEIFMLVHHKSYYEDNGWILKIDRDGRVYHIGGGGTLAEDRTDDMPATSTRIQSPYDLEIDRSGNLYYSQVQGYVRMIGADGIVHDVIKRNNAHGIALDRAGNLYVCSRDELYKIPAGDSAAVLIAGGGDTNSYEAMGLDALDVRFGSLSDVAVDNPGNISVSDTLYRQIFRIDARTNTLGHIAGRYDDSSVEHEFVRFRGPATGAALSYPSYLSLDTTGVLYFTDEGFNVVARVRYDGLLERIAGDGYDGFLGDQDSAIHSRLASPAGIHVGEQGALLIGETLGRRLRRVDLGMIVRPGERFPKAQGDNTELYLEADRSFRRVYEDGTTCQFNERGWLTKEIKPYGVTTEYEYDETGNLTAIMDHWGNRIVFEHDMVTGRMSRVVAPWGAGWDLGHDLPGNLQSITAPDTTTWRFEYDEQSLMTGKTPPGRGKTLYGYTQGRVTRIVPPAGGEEVTSPAITIAPSALSGLMNDVADYVFPDDPIHLSDAHPTTATIQDALGYSKLVLTDMGGLPQAVIDPLGNRTSYLWRHTCQSPEQITLPEGNTHRWEYSPQGKITKSIQPNGGETTYEYDDDQRISTIRYPPSQGGVSPTIYYEYTNEGKVSAHYIRGYVGDPFYMARYEYEYTPDGALSRITNPEGNSREYFYDEDGSLFAMTDYEGDLYTCARNGQGRIGEMTGPSGLIAAYTYDPLGQVTLIVDPLDRVTTFAYHPDGQPAQITTPDGRVIQLPQDEAGRLAGVQIDGAGTSTAQAASSAHRYVYDANGRIAARIDPNDRATSYAYDPAGRLVAITDAAGGQYTYTYDGNGDMISFTDPLQQTMRFERDMSRNVSLITYDSGTTVSFTFRPFMNKIETALYPDGAVVNYEYDPPTGLPEARRDNMGQQSETFDYDELQRPIYMYGGKNRYRYEYDAEGRFSRIIHNHQTPQWKAARFTYDCCGHLLRITDSDGANFNYGYDAAHRLVTLDHDYASTVTFVYDFESDLPRSVSYPGNVTVDYTYTPLMKIASMTVRRTTETLFDTTYQYDPTGNCTRMTLNGEVRDYFYDALDQLVEVRADGVPVEQYTYDAYGNRLTDINGTVYEYDDEMRLTRAGSLYYEYNRNGNVIRRVSADKTLEFEDDWALRLGTVFFENGDRHLYYYDPLNRRVEIDLQQHYIYTLARYFTTDFIDMEYVAAAPNRKFIKHPATGQVLEYYVRSGDLRCFVHHDALQRPVLITDQNGAVVWKADYSAFGKADIWEGSSVTYNRRLPGQYYDVDTGLHYNHSRYYEPEIGRYVQLDPVFRMAKLTPDLLFRAQPYAYAHNNPLNEFDVTGLCDRCDQCPGGHWRAHNWGVEGGAGLGISTSYYEAWCTSNPAIGLNRWISCFKMGAFVGGAATAGPGQLTGCTINEAEASLLGWSGFGGGSIGPFTAGGWISASDWEDYAFGFGGAVGAEVGVGVQYCWLD